MAFEKGNKFGTGRPKGSRNKLAEDFLADLSALWNEQGKDCLKLACAENPMKFIEMVADLLPKEATLNVNETLTLRSESIQALDVWLAELGRGKQDSEVTNTLPH